MLTSTYSGDLISLSHCKKSNIGSSLMLKGPLRAIFFPIFHVDLLPRMHCFTRFAKSRRGRLSTTESKLSVEFKGKATTYSLIPVLRAPCTALSSKIGVKTTTFAIAISSAALSFGTYEGTHCGYSCSDL